MLGPPHSRMLKMSSGGRESMDDMLLVGGVKVSEKVEECELAVALELGGRRNVCSCW